MFGSTIYGLHSTVFASSWHDQPSGIPEMKECGLVCLLRFADWRNVTEPHTDGVTQLTTSGVSDPHVTVQCLRAQVYLCSHIVVREQLHHL